jgi:L-aminopeptidase/D-esterase-like protein
VQTSLCRLRPGPANGLTDVPGLQVGHASRCGGGWLTGTTVIVTPAAGAVAGVDVRGGGPGTRETDLLDPRNSTVPVHAIVLGGGSAYGLAAADGVMGRLASVGRGKTVGPVPGNVVPIVPAAIVFDLGRGSDFSCRPGAEFGQAAYDAAMAGAEADAAASDDSILTAGGDVMGAVGAGTGAVAGGLKGGVGMASAVLEGSGTVAALAVVNCVGSVLHPVTGVLYGAAFGLAGEFSWLALPLPADLAAGARFLRSADLPPAWLLNTTIGVIATDMSLTKAQCAKMAGVGHDGLARAVRPAHSMLDGDTIFGLSVGGTTGYEGNRNNRDAASPDGSAPPALFHQILAVAADCFTRAIVHAVLSAASATTPAGHWPAYLDIFGSADQR